MKVPLHGRSGFVHVCVDTSSFIWATTLPGEKTTHVIQHLLECFAVMGISTQIKTENGPACLNHKFQSFLECYKIQHLTSIEHNPQGQAIIEHTHGTLKL